MSKPNYDEEYTFDYHNNTYKPKKEGDYFPSAEDSVKQMKDSVEALAFPEPYAIMRKGGTKDDTGKPEYDRLSFEAVAHFNSVHRFGDEKYERGNWRKGLHVTRLINAAIRHLSSMLGGETFYDKESGLLHAAHAGVCCEMITHFLLNKEQYKDFIDIEESSK